MHPAQLAPVLDTTRAPGALQPDHLLHLSADRGEGRVSLFLPARNPSHSKDDRARFAAQTRRVARTLRQNGYTPTETEDILTGAWDLIDDLYLWETAGTGLAVFTSPDSTRCFWVRTPLRELATFGERYAISPLLPLLNHPTPYLALLLTSNETRLYHGSRFGVSEVLASSLLFDDSESLRRHFQRLDEAVRGLAEATTPLVVLGARRHQRLYREVNTHPNLILAPAGEPPAEEVHSRSWTVIEAQEQPGNAVTDPAEILTAAREGRVGKLFVSGATARYAGRPAVVRLGDPWSPNELVDEAAVAVLAASGEVITVPAERVPARAPLAATLRR